MVSSGKTNQKELKWDKYVDNSIDNDLSCVPKYYRNHPRVTRTRLPIIKLSKPCPPSGNYDITIKLWHLLLAGLILILIIVFFIIYKRLVS